MKKFSLFLIICIFEVVLSWLSVCGIIKLVTLCFNLKFKWNIATGIWCILCTAYRLLKNKLNIK